MVLTKKMSGKEDTQVSGLELWVMMDRARSAISRSRELELAQYGVTPEQAALLHTLISKGGSATNEDLANTTIRQYNSVTTMVNRMSRLGLLRKDKMQSRNKFQVSITEKGKSIYEKIPMNSLEMTFSVLSLEEKQQLARHFKRLMDKARNMLGMDYKLPFL